MNGWQINYWLCVTGGRRDNRPDSDRGRPDSRTRRRVQVLANRLRIPAIIVLLPAGFAAGALTSDVNPQDLLGPAFEPLVSLSVAVILYDAGLGLDMR